MEVWVSSGTPRAGGVFNKPPPHYYVPTLQGWTIPDPPMGFYVSLPESAECKWSTHHGKYKKRSFKHPLPGRILESFNDKWIVKKANELRKEFWEDMEDLVKPTKFEDLYEFFDSHDLYFQGAYNLWNLVNHLVSENDKIRDDLIKSKAAIIHDWVMDWIAIDANVARLMSWNGAGDILDCAISQKDWEAELAGLKAHETIQLRDFLLDYRARYMHWFSVRGSDSPPPTPLKLEYTGQAVRSWLNETESPPRDTTPPLDTIPEEGPVPMSQEDAAALQRSVSQPRYPTFAGELQGPIPQFQGPLPQFSVSNDNSPMGRKTPPGGCSKRGGANEATASKDDSPESTDTWKCASFLPPVKAPEFKKELQITKSAPSTPFHTRAFNRAVTNAKGKQNSFTHNVAVAGQQPEPSAMHGLMPPPPPPQAGGLLPPYAGTSAQPPVAYVHHSLQQAPVSHVSPPQGFNGFGPQGNFVGLTPAGTAPEPYAMPPFPSGGMMAPMGPHPQGMARSATLPSKAIAGSFRDPTPAMSFSGWQPQHQLPMQIGHGPMHPPTHPMQSQGFQPPMYPQMQTMPPWPVQPPYSQTIANSVRRDSQSSNRSGKSPGSGWGMKVRDDPIHGPTFTHNRAHRLSTANSPSRFDQSMNDDQLLDTLFPPGRSSVYERESAKRYGCDGYCLNRHRKTTGFSTNASECHCKRCVEFSHTVHLRGLDNTIDAVDPAVHQAIANYMGRWGTVMYVRVKEDMNRLSKWATVRFKDILSVLKATSASEGTKVKIPGVGNSVTMGFPFNSKFFKAQPGVSRTYARDLLKAVESGQLSLADPVTEGNSWRRWDAQGSQQQLQPSGNATYLNPGSSPYSASKSSLPYRGNIAQPNVTQQLNTRSPQSGGRSVDYYRSRSAQSPAPGVGQTARREVTQAYPSTPKNNPRRKQDAAGKKAKQTRKKGVDRENEDFQSKPPSEEALSEPMDASPHSPPSASKFIQVRLPSPSGSDNNETGHLQPAETRSADDGQLHRRQRASTASSEDSSTFRGRIPSKCSPGKGKADVHVRPSGSPHTPPRQVTGHFVGDTGIARADGVKQQGNLVHHEPSGSRMAKPDDSSTNITTQCATEAEHLAAPSVKTTNSAAGKTGLLNAKTKNLSTSSSSSGMPTPEPASSASGREDEKTTANDGTVVRRQPKNAHRRLPLALTSDAPGSTEVNDFGKMDNSTPSKPSGAKPNKSEPKKTDRACDTTGDSVVTDNQTNRSSATTESNPADRERKPRYHDKKHHTKHQKKSIAPEATETGVTAESQKAVASGGSSETETAAPTEKAMAFETAAIDLAAPD